MDGRYSHRFPNCPEIYRELPPLKTDKILKWIKEEIFKERYLFYNKEKKQAICSNCGEVDMPDNVKHNAFGECPKCRAKVQYKSMGIGRGGLENRARIMIFQKKGKSVYATLNMIYAVYQNFTVELFKDCEAVYKFNRKEQKGYYTRYGWWSGGTWEELRNIRVPYRTGKWKDIGATLYMDNLKEAFKGTDLKYCELPEQAAEWYPESFIKLVDLNAKFESIEKLHKVGLKKIIESKVMNHAGSAGVRWKKTNLRDILGIPISEIPTIREADFSMYNLLCYKTARKLGLNIAPELINKYDYADVLSFRKYEGQDGRKLLKYLNQQLKKDSKSYYRFSSVLHDYEDYMKECQKLKFDINDKMIRFPRSLNEAHARTSAQIQAKADKAKQKKIKKAAEQMREFNYTDGDFMIRIAETVQEIIIEGKINHNCVGGYVDRVARGETNIFLVRETANPDKTFYTLELNKEKKIVQCRGKLNCNMTDEVKAFVDRWHQEVILGKKPKTKKQKEVA